MRAELRPRIEPLLRSPAPGLAAGADYREDPRYVALREQIARFEAGNPVDWPQIRQLGGRVLTELVKECVCAAYVAYAELVEKGVGGLATGAALLAALAEEQWATLQPPRDRARLNAVSWFLDRAKAELGVHPPSGAPAALAEARAALGWLEEAMKAKAGASAPSVEPVLALLAAAGDAPAREPDTAPSPPAAPEAPPAPPAAPAAAPPAAAPPAAPQSSGRAERWLKPIPGEAPGGQNARYDARYDRVRKEIEKLQSVAGGEADFKLVLEQAGEVLESTSKDLLLASYLAAALGMVEGLAGWTVGVELLTGLLERYWATMFPEPSRLRARANALGWFVDFSGPRWPELKPGEADRAKVEALGAATRALWDTAGRTFEGEGPALRPLLEAVERLRLSLPAPVAPAPPPPIAQPAAAPAAPRPALPDAPSATFDDLANLSAFLSKLGQALPPAARAARSAATSDPAAYRLLRTGLWLHLAALPPSKDGKTTIPAPPAELRKKLEQMAQSLKWAALLEEAESALTQHRLWLDLNAYTDRALEGLGESHTRARQAVRAAVSELLARLPGLDKLAYADGTPLASEAARGYLDAAGGGASAAPGAKPAVSGKPLEDARALAGQGKLGDALVELEQAARRAPSAAEAFELRLGAAELARSVGQLQVGRAMYAALDAEAESRGLDSWAPELMTRLLSSYALALRALVREGKDNTAPEALRRLLERLSRIDPRAVLMILSA